MTVFNVCSNFFSCREMMSDKKKKTIAVQLFFTVSNSKLFVKSILFVEIISDVEKRIVQRKTKWFQFKFLILGRSNI